MSESPEKGERHRARMQRKKDVIDEKIAQARDERGVLLVLTGNGKGKSSSAFGMLARALGHGMQAGVVQFIKGAASTGEEAFFRRFPEQVRYHVMGEGFTWETQDRARDIAAARAGWARAQALIRDPAIRLVLLDEINIALRYGYLDAGEVVDFLLTEKPAMTHVILTGRNAPDPLVAAADLVTEMTLVKHPFRDGIKAQPGVEF